MVRDEDWHGRPLSYKELTNDQVKKYRLRAGKKMALGVRNRT